MSAIQEVEAQIYQAARVRWAAERVVRHLADRGQMDWVLRAKIMTLGQELGIVDVPAASQHLKHTDTKDPT